MANLKLFLILTLTGVAVTTFTIVAVFIIINVCIQKKAEFRKRAQPNNYMNGANMQSTRGVEEPPPLPSRDQFLSEESDDNSYEDIDASSDFKEDSKRLQQTTVFNSSYTSANYQNKMSASEFHHTVTGSYEDMASLPDYVDLEDGTPMASLPDYVDLEDGTPVASLPDYVDLEDGTPMVSLQPLSLAVHTQCEDGQSTSDSYDDVGAFDNSSEDYDDVG
ncbi:uncharacterized protein scimp isoform X2 [Brachyhypopomus gauderio]|uniref:uncharacterized protein scimp isoform X2 n=1 Tax=Brachyhypopomus gauderio TaxID=698409 RepID=UPI0040411120